MIADYGPMLSFCGSCRGELDWGLRINPATGLVEGARQVPTTHCDDRPGGSAVDLVVLHGISLPPGRFGGPWVEALFTGALPADHHPYFAGLAGVRVSSHLFVDRTGGLTQFVPLTRRAWHAGISRFRGRSRCNDFSVGIELEGDDATPYTESQYETLLALLECLLRTYDGIVPDRVVGHCHIAPERKTDPGKAFDWARLTRQLGVPLPAGHWPPEGAAG